MTVARMGWKFLMIHHFHVHFELHWMAYSPGSHEWKPPLPPLWRERCPVALPQELAKPQIQSRSSEPLLGVVMAWDILGQMVSKRHIETYKCIILIYHLGIIYLLNPKAIPRVHLFQFPISKLRLSPGTGYFRVLSRWRDASSETQCGEMLLGLRGGTWAGYGTELPPFPEIIQWQITSKATWFKKLGPLTASSAASRSASCASSS